MAGTVIHKFPFYLLQSLCQDTEKVGKKILSQLYIYYIRIIYAKYDVLE